MFTISLKNVHGTIERAAVVYEEAHVAEAISKMLTFLKAQPTCKIEIVCGESAEVIEVWRHVSQVKFVEVSE